MADRRRWPIYLLMVYALAATVGVLVLAWRMRKERRSTEDLEHALSRERSDLGQARARAAGLGGDVRRLQQRMRELELAKALPRDGVNPATPPTEAPPGAPPGPTVTAEVVREKLKAYLRAMATEKWDEQERLRDELYEIVGTSFESHVALAEFLKTARTEQEAQAVEDFLLWNPGAVSLSGWDGKRVIWATAKEILQTSRDPIIRDSALDILRSYLERDTTDVNGPFLMELLRREADPALRRQIFDSVAWHGPWAMGSADTDEVVRELRVRVQHGDSDMAAALAEWSSDQADFALVEHALGSVTDGYDRQVLLNAFRGDRMLVRGHESQARAVLIRVMSDPQDGNASLAHDLLRETWLPWDAETEAALRRYEEGRDR